MKMVDAYKMPPLYTVNIFFSFKDEWDAIVYNTRCYNISTHKVMTIVIL